ncbi:MAG: hypothetical protein K8I30_10430, partial [Anaerolineae bacterium]|nr:hypothetical protein [Anaerolineae bacterium]
MDVSRLLINVVGLTYIGALVYIANLVEASRAQPSAKPAYSPPLQVVLLRWLLYGLIGLTFMVGLMMLQFGLVDGMSA